MRKIKFRAETLIQTIVAALIFMTVFLISLDTVVRITTSNADAYILVDVDYQISSFFVELADGKHPNGNYTKYFSEGKLSAEISQYAHYANLQLIVINAEMNKIKKRITFTHIIELSNE
jgi:hypothetical protein